MLTGPSSANSTVRLAITRCFTLAPSPLDLVPSVRKEKCEDSESPPVLYGSSAPVEGEGPPGLRQRRAGGAGQELEEELREEDSRREEHWRRILLLIVAVTVHNIPEGLAVGVGFGAIGEQ